MLIYSFLIILIFFVTSEKMIDSLFYMDDAITNSALGNSCLDRSQIYSKSFNLILYGILFVHYPLIK